MVVPTKTKPQTPAGPVKLTVGVEESRAQRHQRQLSRFRDRGGIFVPTTRNTLADILMGRRAASPRKSLHRAASPRKSLRRSASPTKKDTRSADVVDSKKASRKSRVPGLSKARRSASATKRDARSGDVADSKSTASPAKAPRKNHVPGLSKARRSASPTKSDARSKDVTDSKRAASPAKAPQKNRVPGPSKASGQVQKKRKLEVETQETQPTFIGSGDTKTQPKRRATRARRQESLDVEQEKTVRPENTPKSEPAPGKRGAQSRKPAKSKTNTKVLKPLKGLPERVLQRLKNSVPHTMDNEPDPINFLS